MRISIEWHFHHWRHLPLLQRGHHQLNNLLDFFSVLFWIAHCDHPLLHSHSWMHLWRRQGWGNNISCLFPSLHQNEVLITWFQSICSHPTIPCWHFRRSVYILGVKAFMRRFAKKLFPLFRVVIDTFDTLCNPNWSTKTKPILFILRKVRPPMLGMQTLAKRRWAGPQILFVQFETTLDDNMIISRTLALWPLNTGSQKPGNWVNGNEEQIKESLSTVWTVLDWIYLENIF